MIEGKHAKIARATLGWTARQLADSAGIAVSTVRRFESGNGVNSSTVRSIQTALEKAGVEFIDERGKLGVQIGREASVRESGDQI